jgi:hypothetical protein
LITYLFSASIMVTRKAGRWVVTIALDHDAWKVYDGWEMGMKSARVCSAIALYKVNQKKNRNQAAKDKLRDREMYRCEKDLKVANYRLECIQRGDSDPGDGPAVYLEVMAAAEKRRSTRGGRF